MARGTSRSGPAQSAPSRKRSNSSEDEVASRSTVTGRSPAPRGIRFDEILPKLPNRLPVTPSYHTEGPIRSISSIGECKKLQSYLATLELEALRDRLRRGDVETCRRLCSSKQHTFVRRRRRSSTEEKDFTMVGPRSSDGARLRVARVQPTRPPRVRDSIHAVRAARSGRPVASYVSLFSMSASYSSLKRCIVSSSVPG